MASENKSIPAPTTKAPSLSETNARDQFIAAALGQIVAAQIADVKINHDQAGCFAVRYANAAMAWRAKETTPLNVVVSKGLVDALAPPVEPPKALPADAPKSIEELIKEPESAEVK